VIAPGGVATAQTQSPGAPVADATPPKWFAEYQAKVDGRLAEIGKDFGKIRSKFKDDEPATPAASSVPEPVDFKSQFLAAQRFGELSTKLPDAFQQATEFAEMMLASIPSGPAPAIGAVNTPGIAASAAPLDGAAQWTQQKLSALAKTDPAKYDKVCDSFAAQGISLFSLPLV
jgi:hypothetical protein